MISGVSVNSQKDHSSRIRIPDPWGKKHQIVGGYMQHCSFPSAPHLFPLFFLLLAYALSSLAYFLSPSVPCLFPLFSLHFICSLFPLLLTYSLSPSALCWFPLLLTYSLCSSHIPSLPSAPHIYPSFSMLLAYSFSLILIHSFSSLCSSLRVQFWEPKHKAPNT
jgi:hypothetical protein